MVPPPTDPVTAPATGADPVAAAGSDVASTPSTAEPPSQVPTTTPPGQLNTPGVPRGNGVGRDGTPPGQAAKADGTHGPT
jgi:hypothetical protein